MRFLYGLSLFLITLTIGCTDPYATTTGPGGTDPSGDESRGATPEKRREIADWVKSHRGVYFEKTQTILFNRTAPADLTPLAELTDLKKLELSSSQVVDLSFLAFWRI